VRSHARERPDPTGAALPSKGRAHLMCGIAGVFDPRQARAEQTTTEILERMSGCMVERGPDGSGTWVDPEVGIGFGHRRLSILDLSEHGAQPMHSADGRWVLTYNGEIYDHRELAADLDAAGVRRRGHSDTELLLEAIAHRGLVPTLQRIDGMFALALWDRLERRLHLARDRMGEKPLYYGRLGSGELLFGSDLDALRSHPDFDRPVDRDALALFFRHKYVPSPWSIYSGIRKLEPGCVLEIDADGSLGDPEPYWSFFDVVEQGVTFAGSPDDAVDELDRLLRRSVSRRMVADVPVGAFLSGGIDSSTVVAIAHQVSATPVKTFTIGSTDGDFDESSDARKVAEHLGADHTELVVSDADALAAVALMGGIHDEPFADSSQVPTRLVSELARRHVTVALSGDGGDELFAGYNRYLWVPSIWRQLERVPLGLRGRSATLAGLVPPAFWDGAARLLPSGRRPRMVSLKVAKVLGVADAASPYEVFHRLVSHWQQPESLVPGAVEPPTLHTDPTRWPRTPGLVEHMAAVDAVTYLPDDILTKVDRATMSVSLEGRIPLLDRHIVEFAAGLPLDLKIRDGSSKWLLRQVLARYVPSSLFERPKAGFGLPIETWLRGALREWAEELLFSPSVASFVDTALVRAAWDEHQSGRANRAYELWDVLMFAAWCEHRGIAAA
jgi:asparagine synthase (glutamine-hydrolysing)